MIKTPKVGQTLFYVSGCNIFENKVLAVYPHAAQFVSFLYSDKSLLFKTEQLAIQYLLKIYNKEIFLLSRKREKLASRLAEILEKKSSNVKLPKLPKTWGKVNGQKF